MTEPLAALVSQYQKSGLFTDCYAAKLNLADGTMTKVEAYSSHRRVFDLASLTKALSTTVVAFARLTDPELHLPVGVLVPKLKGLVRKRLLEMTPWKLLRHQAGLPAWANFWIDTGMKDSRDDVVLKTLARLPSYRFPPDNKEIYSDIGFLLLALVLEQLAGHRMEEQFRDLGLGRAGLTFRPSRDESISTGFCPVRGRDTVGEAYDENCSFLGGDCGHAGLFGTGDALAHFLVEFRNTSLGQRVMQANVAEISSAVSKKQSSLAGWRLGDDAAIVNFDKGRAIGHYGFTGTAFWVASDLSKALILLTNRTVSGRINPQIKEFRRLAFHLLATSV
jgi:serine-type D-Ala-D-Ala carboxypeptidase